MPRSLKTPTTFQQQVALLQSRQIIISDTQACCDFLERVNYYRLSGYIFPFRDPATGICNPPIAFERISEIYDFDTGLRGLIVSAIEDIEIYVRTQLSYEHAHRYGADGYTRAGSFNQRHNHQVFQTLIAQCINDNSNSPVVRHHINVYGGQFPIWVIVDYFTLGMLSHFYTDMTNRDKSFISSKMYSVPYQLLTGWLRCLTDLRNRCAHYSRLYNWSFPAMPGIPRGDSFVADHTLFSQLYMLKLMYPYPSRWNTAFVKPLTTMMNRYGKSIDKKHIGFPHNWKAVLSR